MQLRAFHRTLKELAENSASGKFTIDSLAESIGLPHADLMKNLRALEDLGFVKIENNNVSLTETGSLASIDN